MHHEDSEGVTSRSVPLAAVIATALLLLTGGAHAAAPCSGRDAELAPMLEKVMPAVVNVATEGKVRMGRTLLDDPLFRHFFDVPDEPRERQRRASNGATSWMTVRGSHRRRPGRRQCRAPRGQAAQRPSSTPSARVSMPRPSWA